MFLVSAQKRSNRLEICRKCEHFQEVTKSCGTLGIGKKIQLENGEKVSLCGCIMPIKTRLKIASCPLEKWTSIIEDKDIKSIETLLKDLDGADRISASQNQKLTELWNKAAGQRRGVSNCNTCVKDMIRDLRKLLKDR